MSATARTIAPDGLKLDRFIDSSPNFLHITRCPIHEKNVNQVVADYEEQGLPLVVEDIHKHPLWLRDGFSLDYFVEHAPPSLNIRNMDSRRDEEMATADFAAQFQSAGTSASSSSSSNVQRCYAKDAPCPDEWKTWIIESHALPEHCRQYSSNDLLNYCPSIETIMCYLGGAETFTPMHKDNCASTGQNLMVYTKDSGSAFWFMTKSSDAPKVADFFRSLRQEVDKESYAVTIEELKKAPFEVYITEQKLGDLVIVPSRSCHQVVNTGGLTVKASWSRMTLKGVATAIRHELPIYRRVCRPETYRCKEIVYSTLRRFALQVKRSHKRDIEIDSTIIDKMDLLLVLFDEILMDEYAEGCEDFDTLSDGDTHCYTCDFCGADIFQSCFGCVDCAQNYDDSGTKDPLLICPGCYAEGRTCLHGIMTPYQCQPFDTLLLDRDDAVKQMNKISPSKSRRQLNSGEALLRPDVIGLFTAGLHVNEWRSRGQRQPQKTCNKDGGAGKHLVNSFHCISCKKCHRAICLGHFLDTGVHSAYILDAVLQDSSDAELHRRHIEIPRTFREQRSSALDAEKAGSQPIRLFRIQLALVAQSFPYCLPVNERAEPYINLGWYDKLLPSASLSFVKQPPPPMATSSSDGLYEWNSDDDKPLQSPTAEVSDHTLVHNSPAPSKRDRTSRPHTRSKPGAVVESNNTLPNFPRKRKSMDAQREDEPSRQDRERERKRKNLKSSDVKTPTSHTPTGRTLAESSSTDSPDMSQVQDPGATEPNDLSDSPGDADQLSARVSSIENKNDRAALASELRDVKRTLEHQTRVMKLLQGRIDGLEKIIIDKFNEVNQNVMYMSNPFPGNDEEYMNEQSADEPANTTSAPPLSQSRSNPPGADGEFYAEEPNDVPMGNDNGGSSRQWSNRGEGFNSGGPSSAPRPSDQAVAHAYSSTAFPPHNNNFERQQGRQQNQTYENGFNDQFDGNQPPYPRRNYNNGWRGGRAGYNRGGYRNYNNNYNNYNFRGGHPYPRQNNHPRQQQFQDEYFDDGNNRGGRSDGQSFSGHSGPSRGFVNSRNLHHQFGQNRPAGRRPQHDDRGVTPGPVNGSHSSF